MNSFNFVAEEQENEDRGSDGRGSKENNNQGADKMSNVDNQEVPNNLDGDHGTDNSPGLQPMVGGANP